MRPRLLSGMPAGRRGAPAGPLACVLVTLGALISAPAFLHSPGAVPRELAGAVRRLPGAAAPADAAPVGAAAGGPARGGHRGGFALAGCALLLGAAVARAGAHKAPTTARRVNFLYKDRNHQGKSARTQTIEVVDTEGNPIGEEKLKFYTFSKQTANYVVHQAYKVWTYQQMPFKKFVARRSDVRAGPKPWKQKGSGRARHGSFYSPLFGKSATNKAPHGLDGKAQKKMPRQKHMGAISTVFQSKWRGMVIVDGLEDWKEPRHQKMVDLIEKVTHWPAGKVRTLMITRSGYGELDMDLHVPTAVSRLNPMYMSGRLIPKFVMRRPRDIDMMADGLFQLLCARKIIISREAFFDLCAKFNAEGGWQWVNPSEHLRRRMLELAEEYPCDRQAEIEAASKLPVDEERRMAWAAAERAKMGLEEVPAVSLEEA